MKLWLKGFKTFDQLSLTLKPLTVLIGPPASGKSNLLEALALLGLPHKILMLKKTEQYSDSRSFCKAEPSIPALLRIQDALEVFPWLDYREPAILELWTDTGGRVEAKLVLHGRQLHAKYSISVPGGKAPEFELRLYDPDVEPCTAMTSIGFIPFEIGEAAAESRLYGYERYSIEARINDITVCGNDSCRQPRDILAETGYNLAYMASKSPLALRRLQNWLREDIEVPIEVKAKRRIVDEVTFFLKETEVSPKLLSDTLLRVLYYLLALYTAARYTRRYSLQGRMLVLLEEPEARAFPYSFEVVTRGISEALDAGAYVVLTTHNGLLLSKLLDTVREDELAVYYMYLDSEGYSRALRVDVAVLAEKMLLLEDLLVMKPGEVLQELGEKTHEGEQR